jgi:hypothetical protein
MVGRLRRCPVICMSRPPVTLRARTWSHGPVGDEGRSAEPGPGSAAAAVVLRGQEFRVERDVPFRFGRADGEGVVGLDPIDMGISALAGAVECDAGYWWILNHSRKRPLFIDLGSGSELRLDSGHRHVISNPRLAVVVRGAILTHRLDVRVPAQQLALYDGAGRQSSGTLTSDVRLSDADRDAVVALFSGYLEAYPRRSPHPADYADAAALLGIPWTKTMVRKRIERIRERLAASGVYFDGPHARHELAEYLIANGIIGPDDLTRLRRGGRS